MRISVNVPRLLAVALAGGLMIGAQAQQPERARDWGIPFVGKTGPLNAITDVPGVTVGMTTLISGDAGLPKGKGPVRTGVTAILPRGKSKFDPVYAGYYSLNGNGDMTGTHWISEAGFLETPVLITNTGSVGVVRDAAWEWMDRNNYNATFLGGYWYAYPVVAETYDGILNDINGQHVKPEHVWQALDSAKGGAVAEGSVGGGTGMMAHQFKGGTGTSSRVVKTPVGEYTVGVLVQANYGGRGEMRIAGVPIGKELLEFGRPVINKIASASRANGTSVARNTAESLEREIGSIIVIIATDAPLNAIQCQRLARRAPIGIARMGGKGGNGSGDIFLAFATGNPGAFNQDKMTTAQQFPNDQIDGLFTAVGEATEESIMNALVAARDMTGFQGNSARALPKGEVQAFLKKHSLYVGK
jgi:L-aminopeptidase/D-esterase-like protein